MIVLADFTNVEHLDDVGELLKAGQYALNAAVDQTTNNNVVGRLHHVMKSDVAYGIGHFNHQDVIGGIGPVNHQDVIGGIRPVDHQGSTGGFCKH